MQYARGGRFPINIAEKYDHWRSNVLIDLQRANKAISIIDFMDYDDLIYYAVKLMNIPQAVITIA